MGRSLHCQQTGLLLMCAGMTAGGCAWRRYGPFWIATTLVFVTAVTGNYASYVSYHHKHAAAESGEAQAWYYDIDKVLLCPASC
jgi:succinate-acetate transporter protein